MSARYAFVLVGDLPLQSICLGIGAVEARS